MLVFIKLKAAGADTRHLHAAVKCVERQLQQELEKYDLAFQPTPWCFYTAAGAGARVAVLTALARGQLLACTLPQQADAVVADAVKVGLRLGTLPFYQRKCGSERYVVR